MGSQKFNNGLQSLQTENFKKYPNKFTWKDVFMVKKYTVLCDS